MLMAGYQTSNFSSFCTDLTSLYPTEVGISLFSHATMYMRNSSNNGLLLRVDCRIVKKQEEETFRTFFHIVLFSCFGQVQIRCIYGKRKKYCTSYSYNSNVHCSVSVSYVLLGDREVWILVPIFHG